MMSSEIISIATQSTTSVDNEQQPSLVQPPPPSKELPMSSFGQRRLYSRIDISGDRWLLPTEKLNEPPSIVDGIDRELDREIRYLGCELIQSGAILLRLPQVAAATGQILFQRYYYQKSFVRFNFEHTAMACLLLASKIEEAPRRPRDIINVFHRLQQMNRSQTLRENKFTPMVLDQHYVDKKNLIIKAERRVLNALGFVVHIKHPHKLIISYLNALKCTTNRHTELIQRAWSHMNDGLRTDMFLRYQPETIACACIFLAARMVTPPVPLPEDPETFNWFELFDASDRDVHSIALMLLQLYQRKRVPNWSRIEKKLDALRQTLYRKGSNVTRDRDRNVNGRSSENDDFKQRKRTRSISSERRKSVPKRYRSPIRKKDRHRERDDDRRSSKLPREVEHRPRHKSKDRRRY